MDKVLVDRGLLAECVSVCIRAFGVGDPIEAKLRAILAQPAEAEGAQVWGKLKRLAEAQPVKEWERTEGRMPMKGGREQMFFVIGPEHVSDYEDWGFTRRSAAFIAAANPANVLELIAALSAVTAERDRLAENRNSIVVTEVYPESRSVEEYIIDADSVRSSWRLIREYREQVEALRKDAERWRYVRLQGDDTHWLNLLRVDLDEFGGNINAAVDALIDGEAPAMAAKEA